MGLLSLAFDTMAPWPLKALSGAKAAASSTWSVVSRYPLQAALAASLIGNAWLYHERSQCRADSATFKAQVIAAEAKATADAIAARAAQEAAYKEKANEADKNYAALRAQGGASLAAYIDAHRVRGGSGKDPTGKAPSPGQGGNPDIPANSPAETVVASVSDLTICDSDYTYARATYEWARGLNKGN